MGNSGRWFSGFIIADGKFNQELQRWKAEPNRLNLFFGAHTRDPRREGDIRYQAEVSQKPKVDDEDYACTGLSDKVFESLSNRDFAHF